MSALWVRRLRWLAGAARLFGSSAVWRLMGWQRSGKTLLGALSSADEDLRTLAGIFLVRGGRTSLPLLMEELEKRHNLPQVLTLIGDIGAPECEEQLRHYLDDQDPEVAESARQALRVLRFQREQS